MTLLCMVEKCKPIRGAHRNTCAETDCKGCLPRTAEYPREVCTACRLRFGDRLTELGIGVTHAADQDAESRTLPSLYDALSEPTRALHLTRGGFNGEPGDDDTDPMTLAPKPMTLAAEAIEARHQIRAALVGWCVVLSEDVHLPVAGRTIPDLGTIIRKGHPLPADTMPAMTAHILRHSRELLADPVHAPRLVAEIDELWVEGRRRAYPTPPPGHVIGPCPVGTPGGQPCGGPVRALVDTYDEDGWASCPKCKTKAVIDWWLALMPPEHHEWLPERALLWHLTLHAHRQIHRKNLYSWSKPSTARPWPELPSVCDIRTRRTLYHVETALDLCRLERRRGRPAQQPREEAS